MISEFKKLPKSEVNLTLEVSPGDLEKFEQKAAQRISEKVEVPGFRPGQAPKAFVMAKVGPDAFFQEVLNKALPNTYADAVKEKNLQVVSRPSVKVLSKSPLKFEVRVAIFPEITMKSFDKIKIPAEPVEVTEKEVDEVVGEMRKYRATFTPIDRGIQKGDRIEIDFQGYDEGGAALDKTKSLNHPLFVGEGSLVPGFEEELEGMKKGEKKKFPLKFPKDFHHEPLKGKKVHFEVELKRAEETILPEVNEEFVQGVLGEKKSVPEFRETLKKDLVRRKKIEERKNRENALLEKFMKEAKLEVPPLLVEEEVGYMIWELQKGLEEKGLKWETYIKKLEEEKRDISKEFEPEAEKRCRLRLVLNHMFSTLGLSVTEEEVSRVFQGLVSRLSDEAQKTQLKLDLEQHGEQYLRIKNNLLLEKLFSHYLGAP